MSNFLDHEELGPAIRRLCDGTEIRCAVAFWGNGASHELFAGAPPADARVICDIGMGGTNPAELEALGAPENLNLRHFNGLHAKVYLSGEGLITGSANASNNGIGFADVAKLVEAGSFHSQGSEAWHRANEWFEDIWERASHIDRNVLDLAASAWRRKGQRGGFMLGRAPNVSSLLETVAAEPGRFRGVGFVFTDGEATAQQRDEAAADLIETDSKQTVSLLSESERRAIEGWNIGDLFSEWAPQDVFAWPQRFICAHRGGRGRISYWFYERAYTTILDGDRGMVLAKRNGALRRELNFLQGSKEMAASDASSLHAIFDHISEEGPWLYESGDKLTELLGQLGLLK